MKKLLTLATAFLFASISIQYAYSQKTVTFVATINPGVLLTDVRDANGKSISKPIVDLGKVINTLSCRNNDALTGTLGNNNQRIYVYNPKAAFDGWTLSIAPSDGVSAKWQGKHDNFDFNDAGGSGCSDSDNDGRGGLMSIDPSNAQIQTDCLTCSSSFVSITHLSNQYFSDSNSITLMSATGDADELGRWYVTGVGVEQTIPSGQDGDTYSIDMVLTATAT